MTTPADQNYSNARRAGRTNADKVEVIEKKDPRHRLNDVRQVVTGRAAARLQGFIGQNRPRRTVTRPRSVGHPLSIAHKYGWTYLEFLEDVRKTTRQRQAAYAVQASFAAG